MARSPCGPAAAVAFAGRHRAADGEIDGSDADLRTLSAIPPRQMAPFR